MNFLMHQKKSEEKLRELMVEPQTIDDLGNLWLEAHTELIEAQNRFDKLNDLVIRWIGVAERPTQVDGDSLAIITSPENIVDVKFVNKLTS